MKFISVRDLRSKSAQGLETTSREKEMVITSNGRPIAIIAATEGFGPGRIAIGISQARAVEAVKSLQRRSVEMGNDKITMDEIDARSTLSARSALDENRS